MLFEPLTRLALPLVPRLRRPKDCPEADMSLIIIDQLHGAGRIG